MFYWLIISQKKKKEKEKFQIILNIVRKSILILRSNKFIIHSISNTKLRKLYTS